MKKKIIKVLDFVIYWLVILLPFSIGIAPAPMNVFMGLLIASFLARKILAKETQLEQSGIGLPLWLLLAITCISVFNSVDLKSSLRGGILRQLQYIFVLFAVSGSIRDKKHLFKIVFSVACGLLLVSIDAIWQVKSLHSFIRTEYVPVFNIGLVRATSSFKDSNALGIYLSGFAPLVFGLALYYYKAKLKIVALSVSFIILMGIALTYSRPTLLATYIVFLFFGIARRDKILLILILVFTLLSPLLLPASVKNWAKDVDYNPLRFMCNDDRIAVYRTSFHMIKAHPIIGVGANAFMSSYKQYKEFPEYRNVVTLDQMKAHNIYLQLAGELGLVGLAIALWLITSIFYHLRLIYKSLDDHFFKICVLSLSACIVAFLVNGLTESSLQYSRLAPVFWYSCGLALALKKFAVLKR